MDDENSGFDLAGDGKYVASVAITALAGVALPLQTIFHHGHGAKFFDPTQIVAAIVVVFLWPAFFPQEDPAGMQMFGWAFLAALALRFLQARWRDPHATGVPIPVDSGGVSMLAMGRAHPLAEPLGAAILGFSLLAFSESLGWFVLTGAGALLFGGLMRRDAELHRAKVMRQSQARAEKIRRMRW